MVGQLTQAEWFKRRCLLRGLALELDGQRKVRPRDSCYIKIQEDYDIDGNPQQVYERFIRETKKLMQGERK